MKTKTMKFDRTTSIGYDLSKREGNDNEFWRNGTYGDAFCICVFNRYCNVPAHATAMWVEFTDEKPAHKDAFVVVVEVKDAHDHVKVTVDGWSPDFLFGIKNAARHFAGLKRNEIGKGRFYATVYSDAD